MQEVIDRNNSTPHSEVSQGIDQSNDWVASEPFNQLKSNPIDWQRSIWFVAILLGGFSLFSRVIFALADNHFTVVEVSQIMAGLLIFFSWLWFKPGDKEASSSSDYSLSRLNEYQAGLKSYQGEPYLHTTQVRMNELRHQHMITQEYIFPFPYLCQIYHLLNLKHLEDVHSFSLSNLKVVKVSDFQSTMIGGAMRFQTILESPINTLRIWRQSLVEVELILHTPYTIELNIPAYGDKRIIVIFNVVPLTPDEHKLLIDVYSNLRWPKPILQAILHLASSLTVFEDFPYLQKLAKHNLERLTQPNRVSSHETMWLFNRFAELYGSGL
jgi:hypothetical protein